MSDQVTEARKCAQAIYLACDAEVASDIARIINGLADILDAIPGDDKLAVAEWAVKIALAAIERHDAVYAVDLNERALAHGVANCHATIEACPQSVREALRKVNE